jgi:branched-chain amino acid transport system substrate-binding protein
MVIVPNSELANNEILNYTKNNSATGFEVEFTLDYKVCSDRAIRIFKAAISESLSNKGHLSQPAAGFFMTHNGEYGLTYIVKYYVDLRQVDVQTARDTVVSLVVKHLKYAGLTLAFPKQDIFVAEMPWRQQEWGHDKDRTWLLSKINLFSELPLHEIKFIAANSEIIEFPPEQDIIRQGEKGDSMFIIGEGLMDVYVKCDVKGGVMSDTKSDENGGSVENMLQVATLNPGSFFGEKSMLTGEERSATVRAQTYVTLCKISSSVMENLFKRDPKLAEVLSNTIINRELANNARFQQMSATKQKEVQDSSAGQFLNKIFDYFSISHKTDEHE